MFEIKQKVSQNTVQRNRGYVFPQRDQRKKGINFSQLVQLQMKNIILLDDRVEIPRFLFTHN